MRIVTGGSSIMFLTLETSQVLNEVATSRGLAAVKIVPPPYECEFGSSEIVG